MANYLFAYKGGKMPENDAEREAGMAAWGAWFESLGPATVDPGNPFGSSKSVASGGSVSDGGPAELTGYSVLTADSLDAATELAKGCPILANDGTVEVYETLDM